MKPKVENNVIVEPFSVWCNPDDGFMEGHDNHIERFLSKLIGMFHDTAAAEKRLKEKGDVKIYEVWEKTIPHRDGELQVCTSITHPGTIGGEYFMTKGHFHARRDTAEIYYCIRGKGYMLMELESGRHALEEMTPGRAVYVPAHFAHRSINTGKELLISLAIYPGDAGHDYGSIETSGFKHLLFEKKGIPEVVENPRFRKM
jgi:glucose-6-phosphate isomerase